MSLVYIVVFGVYFVPISLHNIFFRSFKVYSLHNFFVCDPIEIMLSFLYWQ